MKLLLPVWMALIAVIPAGALPPEWPEVAAYRGDEPISREELAWYCDALWSPEEQASMTLEVLAERLRQVAGDAGERLRVRRILRADGVEVTPELSRQRALRFEPDVPQVVALNPARQLTLGMLAWHMDGFADAKSYDDQAVEEYYRRHQTRFLVPEHRSLRLLLVPRDTPDAAGRIADITARLRQGESFESLRLEFDRSSEAERLDVLRDPAVKKAMAALDATKPDQCSEVLTTARFMVIGQATVYPAYYEPLDSELRNRIRLQLTLLDAAERFERLHPLRGTPLPLTLPVLKQP